MSELKSHIKESNQRFSSLETKIDLLKDNHLTHIQSDISQIKITQALHGQTLEAMKKGIWLVVGPVLGALGVGIINLIT